ncbi:MAG: hypothetical protein A2231_08620 [Candidatus Firestonebacteria bacterium RIFOXYA2_FULL_40_8]|nr:MAG: hypothetical protein A2231_08620 [Candidatus Firestonebacteria bacterium RIFOXYA2_FULL_40_8]
MNKGFRKYFYLFVLALVLIPGENVFAADEYDTFNKFCLDNFGTKQEELYFTKFGKDLLQDEKNSWQYVSENSACISWETSLPAKSCVEYGTTDKYGAKTEEEERYFFTHVLYLKDLTVDTTYHYRLVSVDERGNQVTSADKTLETKKAANAVYIPDEAGKINYLLDTPQKTYILTKDIKVDEEGFDVIAENVTFDLNGHTIRYDFEAGVKADNAKKFKIVNGFIKQEAGGIMSGNNRHDAFNPLTLRSCADVEIAGLSIDYSSPQTWGMHIRDQKETCNVHNNIILDRGSVIPNRHSFAVRSIGFDGGEKGLNKYSLHHNLIKRARQNGVQTAQTIYNNEIYIDSFSTNSFAIQPHSVPDTEAGEHYNNKVFGTGFNAYGFGWAHLNLKIHDNFVFMQGFDTKSRWNETWGDINMLSAMRVTNYDKGGQVRNNLDYRNNVIVMKGREGCEIRGVEFMSDISIKDLVFHDNIIKVEAQDDKTSRVACVDPQGQVANNDTALPVYYKNNTLISNMYHIRFGDTYGVGSNHQFINCKFVRTGNNPKYHTFVFDGGHWSHRHVFLDCEFGEGTKYNDVFWKRTSAKSSYSVKWTLTVKSEPKASVTIIDKRGRIEYTGKTDAEGKVSAVLTQCLIKPPANMKGDEPNNDKHQEVEYTPHSIIVEKNGVTKRVKVTMDKKQEVEIKME